MGPAPVELDRQLQLLVGKVEAGDRPSCLVEQHDLRHQRRQDRVQHQSGQRLARRLGPAVRLLGSTPERRRPAPALDAQAGALHVAH
jgi:hypothetical protein